MNSIVIPHQVLLSKITRQSLRQRLKEETQAEHEALESVLGLMRPGMPMADYIRLLTRFHRFYSAFELYMQHEENQGSEAAAFYCKDRMKREWLEQDLVALGVAPIAHDALTQEAVASLLQLPDHAWGAVYVIEGSTLGGTFLSRHFKKEFDLTPETGLRYFTGYGQDTARKWNLTLQRLQQCEDKRNSWDNIVQGAVRTFGLLKQYLPAGHLVGNANE